MDTLQRHHILGGTGGITEQCVDIYIYVCTICTQVPVGYSDTTSLVGLEGSLYIFFLFYASLSGPRLKCTGRRILGGTGKITEQCVYIYVHNVCSVLNVRKWRAVDTVQ